VNKMGKRGQIWMGECRLGHIVQLPPDCRNSVNRCGTDLDLCDMKRVFAKESRKERRKK